MGITQGIRFWVGGRQSPRPFSTGGEAPGHQIVRYVPRSHGLAGWPRDNDLGQEPEVATCSVVGTAIAPYLKQLPGRLGAGRLVKMARIPDVRHLAYLEESAVIEEMGRVPAAEPENIDLHPFPTFSLVGARAQCPRQGCVADFPLCANVEDVLGKAGLPGVKVQLLLLVEQGRPGVDEERHDAVGRSGKQEEYNGADEPAMPPKPGFPVLLHGCPALQPRVVDD